MARGINKVILVGNLGQDPETRYMPNGKAVTNLRIATSESWKDKQTGEQREQTEWHSIVMYDKLAEIAAEYLRKGSQVYVEGRISYDEFTGQDGQKRYYTDIVCDEMQMLGGRGEGGGQRSSGGERPQRSSAPRQDAGRQESAPRGNAPAPASRDFGDDFADDDIPF